MINELIDRLDSWLRLERPQYYRILLPGLTANAAQELEIAVGMDLPDEFKALYQWRDGQPAWYESLVEDETKEDPDAIPIEDQIEEGSGGLIFTHWWMNSSQIVFTMELMNELLDEKEGVFGYAGWWQHEWVPFLTDGYNYWCLDLAGSFGGRKGQIIECGYEGEREIRHKSFSKWLQTVVKAMERGIITGYYPDHQLWLQYEAFIKENNPGYPIIHMIQRPRFAT